MPSVGKLREELDDITTLKFISSAFTEASMVKLQKIRKQFEVNKEFYEDISALYHVVRVSGQYVEDKDKAKEAQEEKRLLSVALTSNQRFYGSINVNIMRQFTKDMATTKGEIMVIGKTGKDFMRTSGFTREFEALQFAKETPTKDEVKKFLEQTKAHDVVYVYYPKFKSLVTQEVAKIDITQAASTGGDIRSQEKHILFEPEYSNTLEFFREHIRSILFFRVLLEADLSRTAARMISMSAAEERSTEMIKEKKAEIRKVVTSMVNRQLLETFAGIAKWKK